MKVEFPPKLVGETKTLMWDFSSDLAIGETLSTASVVSTVWSGNDPAPSATVSGTATVNNPQVTQKLTGGVAGSIYQLICTAVTSAGNTLQGYGLLAVLGALK